MVRREPFPGSRHKGAAVSYKRWRCEAGERAAYRATVVIFKRVLGFTIPVPGTENRDTIYLNDKGGEINLKNMYYSKVYNCQKIRENR